MAWRFPDRKLEANSVIGIEDTNSAMLPSVEEATGQLNEQNFARNAFTTVLDYEKDIAYRHAKLEVDVAGSFTQVSPTTTESMYEDNNTALLSKNTSWQTIQDQGTNTPFRYDFVSRGGLLFITARLWGAQYAINTGALPANTRLNPILFAIKLNGALIQESTDGNLDALDYQIDLNTGNTGVFSVNIDFVVPVIPGETTVEVVARVRPQDVQSEVFVPMVGSRALILWEISK